MKVWVDFANSPHVIFFRPIIDELRVRGHEVLITSRDFAETIKLANKYFPGHTPIGSHGGSSLWNKAASIWGRAWKLKRFAKQNRVDLAIGHNSYAQTLGAWMGHIESVTLMDYEYTPANHLCFRLADRVIVSESFPEEQLRKYGALRGNRTRRYPGIKEEIYLAGFDSERAQHQLKVESASGKVSTIDLAETNQVTAIVRPPATMALYHRFANPLFEEALRYLLAQDNLVVIFLPRTVEQWNDWAQSNHENLLTPIAAVDGPGILHHADIVMSAGGTMNREAAVLGTPTYTIFKGQRPAVDQRLIDSGRMHTLEAEKDFATIVLQKKRRVKLLKKENLLSLVVDQILQP